MPSWRTRTRRGAGGDAAGWISVSPAPDRPRSGRVRLVLQRRLEPDALVCAALSMGPRGAPNFDHGLHHAWNEGYLAVNQRLRRLGLGRARAQAQGVRLLSRLSLVLGPLVRPRGAPGRDARRISCISRGPSPTTGVSCRTRFAGLSTRECWRTTSSASTRLVGGATSFAAARTSSARRRIKTAARSRLRDRITRVRCAPISVDRASSRTSRGARKCLQPRRRSSPSGPEFLVVRVDRTDPSKNVVRGFRAFDLYLEAHPEMHGRVGMLALLDPSRQDIPEYSEYLGAIQRSARA